MTKFLFARVPLDVACFVYKHAVTLQIALALGLVVAAWIGTGIVYGLRRAAPLQPRSIRPYCRNLGGKVARHKTRQPRRRRGPNGGVHERLHHPSHRGRGAPTARMWRGGAAHARAGLGAVGGALV